MGGINKSDADAADEADKTGAGVAPLAGSVKAAIKATILQAPTVDDLRGLQRGDRIISKTGTIREVQEVIGDTVIFRLKKDYHGSNLDGCFMNRSGEHLRQHDYDPLQRGDIVHLLATNVPHVILEVYRENDPVGSLQPFVSGISTLSIEMVPHFSKEARIDWIDHIEKALPAE